MVNIVTNTRKIETNAKRNDLNRAKTENRQRIESSEIYCGKDA